MQKSRKYEISVGYNQGAQTFFDLIYGRKRVTSWYFSLTHENKIMLDPDKIVSQLSCVNTYNIPANLLLNYPDDVENWHDIILKAQTIPSINIRAVSVEDPSIATAIKREFGYRVHLSVRKSFLYRPSELNGIDVYNISGVEKGNDISLMNECHRLGMKVKYVVNEWCLTRCDKNFGQFEELKRCHTNCKKVIEKNPWLKLAGVEIYKEQLDIYPIDIIKLATRSCTTNEIKLLLNYWDNQKAKTEIAWGNIPLNKENYLLFQEWIKLRSKCNGLCYNCKACQHIYDSIKKESSNAKLQKR